MNEDWTNEIIGAAVEVQRALGHGLLESVYAAALEIELLERQLAFQREVPIAARYKGQSVGLAFRADFIVENQVIVEIKAVEALRDEHKAQLLTYMRLTELPLGLLLNFNDFSVAKNAKRLVNKF